MANESNWKSILDDLARRLRSARAMGGVEKLARQHEGGRLDARQRIAALCDPDGFRELGTLVGGVARGDQAAVPADALVAGMGSIEGRPVLVGAEDFTVRGGSIGIGTHAKRVRMARLARQERVPLIMLLDGAGERSTNALERYPHAPNDLQELSALSGRVPTVAVVMGPSAGHGALTAPLMDFVIMVEGAALFAAGPPLVAVATGEQVAAEELGGAALHTAESGVAHNRVSDDAAALALVRRYLGYLPSNAWERPPSANSDDCGERLLDDILEQLPPNPRQPYDVREVLIQLADRGSLLEIQPDFGSALITALLRLGGRSIAALANQPLVRGGSIDREAADKGARFLEFADAFHLPTLFLADTPGVLAGSLAERSGVLRSAARMYAAQANHRGPKLHVTLRKAYGFGSSLMAMNPFDAQTLTLALPTATLGAMPARGAGMAARESPEVTEQLRAGEAGGPWGSADGLAYDEVIDPRELRNALLAALELARGRETQPVEPRRSARIRP